MHNDNALLKAMACARELAQERLTAGARALQRLAPGLNVSERQQQAKHRSTGVRPLCRVLYPHRGAVLVAEAYADGVVRIKGLKHGLILAVSEPGLPGLPGVLSASYVPLTSDDLASQIR